MAKSLTLVIVLFLLLTIASPPAQAGSMGDMSLGWATAGGCHGSTAECDGEFEMDSEINRRILATTDYISYQALQRNSIPCSRRGASYYNCRAGAQANPYSRGCSAIARCRS
ncbi:PREDICTED: protein RALF-like 1 [Tarenaya hassleriana]|uniref:protein RALF-like 1 n=1 Tax=Tarenaya hassleriana TaxID=28532 RepID=UPI00053C5512|nr:PREDICTED: protein RALF-like 1 [Tarenaya hassleriana]